MEEGNPLTGFVVAVVLLLVDIVFFGFGAAIQNLNKGNVEKKAEEGDKKSILLNGMIESPAKLVNTIQLLTTLINIMIGAFELHIIRRQFTYWFVSLNMDRLFILILSWILAIFCFLILLSVFGILVPKKIASKNSEKWAYALVPLIHSVMILFTPVTAMITVLSNLLIRFFGIDPNAPEEDVTEEEILSMVNEVHEQGVLLASEAEMINNIFEFGDKEAKDIMTHRKNIIAVDGNEALKDAVHFMIQENNSRYPVYDGDIDNIIGIVHVKDAMRMFSNKALAEKPISEIKDILMKVKFIPETRNVNILFKAMQSQKIHMVVVIDEYGQTTGILTMEDILEEIVGNILDEYDEDENFIQRQEDESLLIDGMTPLDDVEEVLGIELQEEFETLNGFLVAKLDRIPSEEETPEVESNGFLFKVLKVENKTIQSVLVSKAFEKTDTDSEG